MKKIIFSFLLCLMLAGVQNAIAQKLGHLNSFDLLDKMPEKLSADKTLEEVGKSLQTEYQSQIAAYEQKVKDYQEKVNLMADAVKKVKEKEIMDMQQNMQDFQTNAQENLETKKAQLYEPILKKAQEAIKTVAKNGGYNYVFDTSAGTLLYFNESEDILPLVLKQLGL